MFGEQPPLGSQELSSGVNLTTQSTSLQARGLLTLSGETLLCLYYSRGSGGCRVFSVFWKQTFSCALPHSPSLLGVSHFAPGLTSEDRQGPFNFTFGGQSFPLWFQLQLFEENHLLLEE